MNFLCYIVGLLLIANGVLNIPEEKGVFHQVYVAVYIVGGTLMLGLGAIVGAINLIEPCKLLRGPELTENHAQIRIVLFQVADLQAEQVKLLQGSKPVERTSRRLA